MQVIAQSDKTLSTDKQNGDILCKTVLQYCSETLNSLVNSHTSVQHLYFAECFKADLSSDAQIDKTCETSKYQWLVYFRTECHETLEIE